MSQNYTSVKTIWGLQLEASRRPGGVFSPVAYSTVNEKLLVPADASKRTPSVGNRTPEINVLMIGRGGHQNAIGGQADSLVDTLTPRINAATLQEPIAFLTIPTSGGSLPSGININNFCLEKTQTYGGIQYTCYYGMFVDTSVDSSEVNIQKITIDPTTRATSRVDYTPDANTQLSPTPLAIVNGAVNNSTNVYLEVSSPFKITINADTVAAIMDGIEIRYGDVRYGVISEMAICSSVKETVSGTNWGATSFNKEALWCNVFTFISTFNKLQYQSSGFSYNFALGQALPYRT